MITQTWFWPEDRSLHGNLLQDFTVSNVIILLSLTLPELNALLKAGYFTVRFRSIKPFRIRSANKSQDQSPEEMTPKLTSSHKWECHCQSRVAKGYTESCFR